MANDINSVTDSFTNILLDNYKQELLEGDVSKILIDMLTNEEMLKEIIKIFYRYYDFLQFFIFYFKNMLPDGGFDFSLEPLFSNVLEPKGGYEYVDWLFHGKYKFEEKLDLSPNYFKGVENIPPDAFSHWYSLNKVTLSNDVKSIDDRAFYSCNKLTNIEISSSVSYIGDSAFTGCKSLTSITIPEGVTRLGAGAFSKCESLESVVISGKLRTIPKWVFNDCPKLTNVVISKYINVISDWSFENCKSLKTIVLPDGLKRIGDGAFRGCLYLTNIVIPDSVIKIGDESFGNCHSLTSLRLPSKLEKIGSFIFDYCENTMNDVTYNGTKEQWQKIEKSRYWYMNWVRRGKPKEIKCTDEIIKITM